MNKLIFRVGTVAYTILAILAFVFYVERTVFLDISFHLFYILKDGSFAIQNSRFGAFFTQLFPLIGSKLGLSLIAIMKLYSVGFILYYFSIFLIVTKVFDSYKLGLTMLLFSTLMVTDTFYWMQSELPQGLAFMILYFALLRWLHKKEEFTKWLFYPILGVMIFTIVFFHPLLVFPFLFFSIFLYMQYDYLRDALKGSLLLYLLIFVIKSFLLRSGYDSTAISGMSNFKKLFPDYIFLQSNKQFLLHIASKYYLLIIVFFGMLFYYFKRRKFYKAILMSVFFIGYLALVNVSYPNGADAFYIENLHLPLSIFIAVPFAFDFRMEKKYFAILIVLMLGIRLVNIGTQHELYTDRLNMLKGYLERTKSFTQKKIIISEKYFSKDTLLMSWGSPYEFWLLSTAFEKESRSIMISDNVKNYEWQKGYKDKFLGKWGTFNYSELPPKYFKFRDTTLYDFKY